MADSRESVTFDRAASFYDRTRGFPEGIDRKAAALMASVAGITDESVVVEIGVGTGRIALPLAERSGVYIGVDLSASMLSVLQSKRADYADADIRPICGDVMRLPLADSCADFAVLVHILHLIPDPMAAVTELARILKAGGAAVAGWNRQRAPSLAAMDSAWERVTGNRMAYDELDASVLWLRQAGGRLRAEEQLRYFTAITPAERLETFRQRIFSSMWDIPEAIWREGVAAAEAAMHANYPDPHMPHVIEHTFFTAVYDGLEF